VFGAYSRPLEILRVAAAAPSDRGIGLIKNAALEPVEVITAP
jgi:hypothetical protein